MRDHSLEISQENNIIINSEADWMVTSILGKKKTRLPLIFSDFRTVLMRDFEILHILLDSKIPRNQFSQGATKGFGR